MEHTSIICSDKVRQENQAAFYTRNSESKMSQIKGSDRGGFYKKNHPSCRKSWQNNLIKC